MQLSRRGFLEVTATAAGTFALATMAGCGSSSTSGSSSTASSAAIATGSLALDDAAWNYDGDNDVYWQIGIVYCATPEATDYESLGVYVPGSYMDGSQNPDGTYTCAVNASGSVGGYTASTAPIIIPVNTAGYSAQQAPTSYDYSNISAYLEAGLIYLYAGLRGRDNGYDDSGNLIYSGGAPWGATDLKAAVRWYRYNALSLPGDSTKMFTFGHSGGGAQSAITGATGDSALYTPYLESIGAAMEDASGTTISDAVYGSMCWCPITSLDFADEAYEWNMGQFATSGTRADGTWTKALSEDLAGKFADYVNALGLKTSAGTVLSLEESSEGIYLKGSYYDYLMEVVQTSLNDFLSDTTFPYTPSSTTMADGGFGGGGTGTSGMSGSGNGAMSGGSAPSGSAPSDAASSGSTPSGSAPGGSMPNGSASGSSASSSSDSSSTSYDTAQAYIDSLNSDEAWITYDATTDTATISSMSAFITHCKTASKDVCAFDDLDRGQAENNLFGNDDEDSLHFDSTIAGLLADNSSVYAGYSDYDSSYAQAYASDLALTDKLGNDVPRRVDIYNPMYFISSYYGGYGSSTIAPHWRIRTGIDQGDTALTVETNLALALEANDKVDDVDFATVWGLAHTTAERTGSATTNFIDWVQDCCQA